MPQPNGASDAPAVNEATTTEQVETTAAPETPTTSHDVSDMDLAQHLNLPAEVMQELSKETAKGDSQETPDENANDEGGDTDEPEPEQSEEGTPDQSEETDDDETEDAESRKEPETRAMSKMRKRIDRLTRKLDRERQLREAAEEAAEGQQPRQTTQEQVARQAYIPELRDIHDVGQLESLQQRKEAEVTSLEKAIINNSDGITVGEGENEKYYSVTDMQNARADAQELLRQIPWKRKDLEIAGGQRQKFNQYVSQIHPELFDQKSEDYKAVQEVLTTAPWVAQMPGAALMLSRYVRGKKAEVELLNKQSKANGKNGQLDNRLDPSYQRDHIPPTAPVVPKPPNRSSMPMSRFKKVENAAQPFTRTSGGNSADLADVLRALDEDEPKGNRTPARGSVIQ